MHPDGRGERQLTAPGIKQRLEDAGHTVVVTDDKEGPDSVMQKEIGALDGT